MVRWLEATAGMFEQGSAAVHNCILIYESLPEILLLTAIPLSLEKEGCPCAAVN